MLKRQKHIVVTNKHGKRMPGSCYAKIKVKKRFDRMSAENDDPYCWPNYVRT